MHKPFLFSKAVSSSLFFLIIFGFALQAAAQTYVSRVPNGSGGYYIAFKEIGTAETWTKAGSPYIVETDVNFDNCGVDVLAGGSLTIEPGVVVRFTYGREHASLVVRGTLTALGTVADPIVFIPDPAGYAQEWGGIQCLGGSSVNLSYVNINNAGHVNSGWQAGFVGASLYIDSCAPSVQNCSIDSSRNDGIKIYTGAAPVITNCIVTNSANYAANWVDVSTSAPVITGLTGTGNKLQGIAVGAGRLKHNAAFGKNDIPWYLTGYDDNLVVDTGVTLTVPAGAVVKSNYGRDGGALVVDHGTLNCPGAAGSPIVFTSYLDDSVAGDFSVADTAKAYKGAWSGLRFINGALGNLSYVTIKYSGHVSVGWQGWHPAASIYLVNSSPSFFNITIVESDGAGVKFSSSAAAFTTGTITRAGGWAAIQEGDSLKGIPSFSSVTASKCAINGIGVFGVLSASLTLTDNLLPYVIDGWLTVPAGKKLTIDPGAVVKSTEVGNSYKCGLYVDGGALDASGTQAKPVVFTSLADDAEKGNTDNNDTLKPVASDWNGIVAVHSASLTMKWCHINYAGYRNDYWNPIGGNGITADNSALAISNCSIFKTGQPYAGPGGNGMSLTNCTGTVHSLLVDSCFAAAIRINQPLYTIPSFSATTARGCAYNAIAFNGAVTGKITLATDSIPYYLDGRCGVVDSGSLSFGPGAIVKIGVLASPWDRDIQVSGTFNALGTAQKPVVFTTILDDSIGGATSSDTAKPLYSGSGDWEGICFVDSLARGSFQYCTFKYGGYGNSAWNGASGGMIYISKGIVSVKDSRFFGGRGGYTHGGAAVYMNGGTLSGSYNSVANCTHGIYADGAIDSASFTFSNFDSGSGFAARNIDAAHYINASYCWWGSPDGPSGAGPGKGAKVSTCVTIIPFQSAPVSGSSPIIPSPRTASVFKPYVKCSLGHDGRMVLRYSLSESGMVFFAVYTLSGRTVYSHSSVISPRQSYTIVLPSLSAGKYLYRFRSPLTMASNLITVLR